MNTTFNTTEDKESLFNNEIAKIPLYPSMEATKNQAFTKF